MNEEEAIERLKYIDRQYDYNNYYSRYDLDCIAIVLNLLEKKDRQINSKNGTINALQCALKERTEERDRKDELYNKALNDLVKVEHKNIKKDKMIDLMLEEISKNILNTCPLADYNVDLDCENKCKDDYKACWKQYFEREVKQ